MNDPTQPVWADAIETLVALGELELARDYLERSRQRRAARQPPGAGWSRCAAAACFAAEGRPAAAVEAFERSLAEPSAYPLERGRTLLCLGAVRRQAQQKPAARGNFSKRLRSSKNSTPARGPKGQSRLRRISGRQAAAETLTETERRVATLAARGRSNKEIAAELFMGVSTVEAHLSRVYRKLGVRAPNSRRGSPC